MSTSENNTPNKNETNQKVSLEQLIKKKLEKDEKKNVTKEIYVESLDGHITVTNPSDSQRIEFADKTKSGSYLNIEKVLSDFFEEKQRYKQLIPSGLKIP